MKMMDSHLERLTGISHESICSNFSKQQKKQCQISTIYGCSWCEFTDSLQNIYFVWLKSETFRQHLTSLHQLPPRCKQTWLLVCLKQIVYISHKYMCVSVSQSCPTLCDPMDYSPPGYSVHGDSPGKNAGVGCHALHQGVFPTQGWNRGLPHCRQILYHLSHQGEKISLKPKCVTPSHQRLTFALRESNSFLSGNEGDLLHWLLHVHPKGIKRAGQLRGPRDGKIEKIPALMKLRSWSQ